MRQDADLADIFLALDDTEEYVLTDPEVGQGEFNVPPFLLPHHALFLTLDGTEDYVLTEPEQE